MGVKNINVDNAENAVEQSARNQMRGDRSGASWAKLIFLLDLVKLGGIQQQGSKPKPAYCNYGAITRLTGESALLPR